MDSLSPHDSLQYIDSPKSPPYDKLTLNSPHFNDPSTKQNSPDQFSIQHFLKEPPPTQNANPSPVNFYQIDIQNIEDTSLNKDTFRAYSFQNPNSAARQFTHAPEGQTNFTAPVTSRTKENNKTLPHAENITFQGTHPDYIPFHASVVLKTGQSNLTESQGMQSSKSHRSQRGTSKGRPSTSSKLSKLELTEEIMSRIDDSKKISFQAPPRILEPILSELEQTNPEVLYGSVLKENDGNQKQLQAQESQTRTDPTKKQFFNLTGVENESMFDHLCRMGNRFEIDKALLQKKIIEQEEAKVRARLRAERAIKEKSEHTITMMKHYSKQRQVQFRLNNMSYQGNEDALNTSNLSNLSNHMDSFKLDYPSKSKIPKSPIESPMFKKVTFAIPSSRKLINGENLTKTFTFNSAIHRRILPDKSPKEKPRPKRTLPPSNFIYKVYKLPREAIPEDFGPKESVHPMGSLYHKVYQFTNYRPTLPKISNYDQGGSDSSTTLTLFHTIQAKTIDTSIKDMTSNNRSKSHDSKGNLLQTGTDQEMMTNSQRAYNTELKKLLKTSVYTGYGSQN